jgi:hypothetical protein
VSKTVQTLDLHGNLTQSLVYDYASLTIPARTYTYTYLTGANYNTAHIYNRLTSATMNAITLVTNQYDGNPAPTCSGALGLAQSSVPLDGRVTPQPMATSWCRPLKRFLRTGQESWD